MRRSCQLAVTVLLIGLSSAVYSTDTQQGLSLINSYPEPGSVLTKPLKSVRLRFDRAPSAQPVRLSVDGEHASFELTGVHAMGETDLMAMVLKPVPDGAYKLRWRVGAQQGEIPFRVQRPDGFVDDDWTPPLDIGVVLYDGAEPLDVFGPLEMWMNAGPDNIRVHLIAEEKRPVVLTTTSYPKASAPLILAQYAFEDTPELDVLMVPGGVGTLVEVDNPNMIAFLKRQVPEVAVATSVCTGSALLAKAGLLEGVKATGNKVFFDYIVSQGKADWQLQARWVESGRFFTSSGVSAGIDMSLAVVARFFGMEAARMIAAATEYEWNEDPSRDPFVRYANTGSAYTEALRERFMSE